MRIPLTLGLCAAAASLAACSTPTSGDAGPLGGDWRALCGVDVACHLQLQQAQSSVAGRFGHSNVLGDFWLSDVTGTIDGSTVHLSWTESNTPTTFDATLSGDSLISVTAQPNGMQTIYVRQR